jgi:hypothetical protein
VKQLLTPEQAEAVRAHLERAAALFRHFAETVRALARQVKETAAYLADVLRTPGPPHTSTRERPAWQSPYGPAPRGRHRRT